MPNTKSAKKRFRQSQEERLRNRSVKSVLRNIVRKYRLAIEAKQIDEARAMYPKISKTLDQAAAKGVIHSNKASRLKSRLAAAIVKAAA